MKLDVGGLLNDIKKQRSALIALSGGLDSSVVAALAQKALGARAVAVTIDTGLLGAGDLPRASSIAARIDIKHLIHRADPLSLTEVRSNKFDRCYHCKSMMLSELEKLAEKYGMNVIMDGTNASDAHAYRPGMKALAEHDVYSPLMKYSKEEIRALGRELKLGVEDFTPTTCLLTRFPYDTSITREMIERIREAESYIAALGITQCRVRNHRGIARIEIHEKDLARLMAASDSVVNAFVRLGFTYVTLDLQWFRSGSMDHTVKIGDAPSFNIQRAREWRRNLPTSGV